MDKPNNQNQVPNPQKQDPKYAGSTPDADRNKQAQGAWGDRNKENEDEDKDNQKNPQNR